MATQHTRRDFLARVGAAAAGVALTGATAPGCSDQPGGTDKRADKLARHVVIARDEKLAQGAVDEHRDLLRKLLDGSVQRLTGATDAGAAWRGLFGPKDRVGIKVNTLGLSTQPAEIFGLHPRKGTLAPGSDADLVLLDPELEVTISPETVHGVADYSPYDGWAVRGWPVSTMVRGEWVVRDRELTGSPDLGSFVHRGKVCQWPGNRAPQTD